MFIATFVLFLLLLIIIFLIIIIIIVIIIIIIEESGTKVGVGGWSVNAHLPLTLVRSTDVHDRDDDDTDADDVDHDHDDDDEGIMMTMTMTPTHGKRHSDSIANRYRPATETLSYLNAWTEKQSAPHTQSQGSDMCPEEKTTPVSIQEKEGT